MRLIFFVKIAFSHENLKLTLVRGHSSSAPGGAVLPSTFGLAPAMPPREVRPHRRRIGHDPSQLGALLEERGAAGVLAAANAMMGIEPPANATPPTGTHSGHTTTVHICPRVG